MNGVLVYAVLSIRRRWHFSRATYLALAVTSALALLSVIASGLSSIQLSEIAGSYGLLQLHAASNALFVMGTVVSVLQLQVIVVRSIEDRKGEFSLLAALGISRWRSALTITIECLIQVTVGWLVAGLVGAALMKCFFPSLNRSGNGSAATFLVALFFSWWLPLLAVMPISACLALSYARMPGALNE
jgi:ABC-type antimicrobial peptide transport system permease subunit